ncbi:MAG: long-chain fatty acid--CoA ligase [Bacteroidales bacterium]|nr:long-chain fatty acid--CoA ligase [Bacteroidales bacterium]
MLQNQALQKKIALVDNNCQYTYRDLLLKVNDYEKLLLNNGIENKTVIIYGDFDINSVTMFLALLITGNVVALMNNDNRENSELQKTIGANFIFDHITENITKLADNKVRSLTAKLFHQNESGIIFFSSGTTGKPKAILHSATKLLKKYQFSKKPYRTLGFLLFDHIAGIDTLLYTLFANGTLVRLTDRSPDNVYETLREKHVEVFPTSPSFLTMLIIRYLWNSSELPDLKIITFGSERMTDETLKKTISMLGTGVRVIQKYGVTEMGSPIVKSKPDDPLWISIDRRTTDYKIENGVLFLKGSTSMLGYIFHDRCEEFNGWFNTQDKVEVDGEWIKILGRTTDIINVGGQKVYPAEVESILLEMDNIIDVTVYSKNNPIMGKVVAAKINLQNEESSFELKKRIRKYCKDKMESYKIPAFIEISKEKQITDRFKKVRL